MNKSKIIVYSEGSKYIIDSKFNNYREVELVRIYDKHFCEVRCVKTNSVWETMLYRLSNKDGRTI